MSADRDSYEGRVGYWFRFRRKTHDIKVGDTVVGQLYDDGSMTFDDPPSAAPPVRASDDG